MTDSNAAEAAQEVCEYCRLTIYGGPGVWHTASGAEVCDQSETGFHEVEF